MREATCADEGERQRKCAVCGEVQKEDIPKLSHSFGSWTVTKKATCTSAGTRTRTCTECGTKETDSVAMTDHTYTSWTTTRQATCTSEGARRRTCTECGYAQTDTIDKKGHEYGSWTTTREATCTSTGLRRRTCANCGNVDESTISKLNHGAETYDKVITAATCSKTGTANVICKYCDKVVSTKTLPKTEHTIGEWTVTKRATMTSGGVRQAKCKVCGETITETFAHGTPGKSAFKSSRSYNGNFKDVQKSDWFYDSVKTAYEYTLVNGKSAVSFEPNSHFTVAETLTVAANIHTLYNDLTVRNEFEYEKWYQRYVDYCIENGIITDGQFDSYERNITRGEMAIVFASILPEKEYGLVKSGVNSDVTSDMGCYEAVKKLYSAGIVTGDDTGLYRPGDDIIRSEACVIFSRIAIDDKRVKA